MYGAECAFISGVFGLGDLSVPSPFLLRELPEVLTAIALIGLSIGEYNNSPVFNNFSLLLRSSSASGVFSSAAILASSTLSRCILAMSSELYALPIQSGAPRASEYGLAFFGIGYLKFGPILTWTLLSFHRPTAG
eukprot:NODE_19_length_39463_cov_0.396073.p22 type:complete len:135 gc:universal NODE_19_length_39463_cov_0.396073:25142-25546(+)